jgi:molybdate transport system substrate-binding protein
MKLRLAWLLYLLLFSANLAFAQVPTIAVAANMKDAFLEIITAFKPNGKSEMRIVYGSSGNFTTQILNGAPFNLFIAADEHFPLELYKSGKTVDEGAVYAIGKLAIIARKSSGIQLFDSKDEMVNAIQRANKISIAKPDLSPYGKATVEYLRAEGLWDIAKNKLVYADNIGVATTYVVSGAADIGFTAVSLAMSPEVVKASSFLSLNPKLYEPIKQRMVLIKGAPQDAVDLYRFMQTPQAKTILQRYGYITP